MTLLVSYSATQALNRSQLTQEVVRPSYERFPQSPSSRFLEVLSSGDRTKNPSGRGGFPFDKASASVGKQIVDYKTARIGEAILQGLRAK